MDLYADLPLAKGAAADAGATSGSSSSPAGVAGFVPGQPRGPSPAVSTTSASMLPASLASRARSPGSALAAAMKPAGRGGISLAFRPASVTRKPSSAATTAVRNGGGRGSMTSVFDAHTQRGNTDQAPGTIGDDAAPRGGLGFVAATTWTQVAVPKEPSADDSLATAAGSGGGGNTHFFQATYRDEYHPSRPNSYEAFCEERAAKKKMEIVKRELEERQREQDRESKREREQFAKDVSEGKAPSIALPTSAGRGRGMTVPAWMKKKIEESATKAPVVPEATEAVMAGTEDDQFDDAPARGGLGFTNSKRSEPGLPVRDEFGRDLSGEQGRLDDRDCSRRRSRSRSPGRGQSSFSRTDRSGSRGAPHPAVTRPGRVILLQNMVGPGEADDELEEEVKEECSSKYGPVEQCVVFEVRGRVSPEEAVRIFVQFRQQTHADQALNGLNSRFFGGRRVKATYYDEGKFALRDLRG